MQYTKHALEKMDGLGLEKDDVTRVIATGMKWKERVGEKWRAQQAGVEVVFVKQGQDIFVITVYLAEREK